MGFLFSSKKLLKSEQKLYKVIKLFSHAKLYFNIYKIKFFYLFSCNFLFFLKKNDYFCFKLPMFKKNNINRSKLILFTTFNTDILNNQNFNLISNLFLIDYLNVFNLLFKKDKNHIKEFNKKHHYYSNYYPAIFLENKNYDLFFNKFKIVSDTNNIYFLNKVFINFFENFFKKKIFLKITNNHFNKIKNSYFLNFKKGYSNFQPLYFKNFLFADFLDII